MDRILIHDIIEVMDMHNLDSVSIFGSKKNKNKSIASAVALALFLNKIDIKANVILEEDERLSFSHYLISKKPLTPHFLAIAVDCKKTSDIETKFHNDSFFLMNVYGPLNAKGFGVLNYVLPNVCGAAEVIYEQLSYICEERNMDMGEDVATYLYMSLLAATKHFSTNIRANTFSVAKELLNRGMDYQNAFFLLSKKPPETLKCQEIILKSMVQENTLAYAVLSKAESIQYTKQNYMDAIEAFRNIGNISVWVVFLDYDTRGYDVLLQSDSSYRYNMQRITRKNKGQGSEIDGEAFIQKFDLEKILNDVRALIRLSNKEALEAENEQMLNYDEYDSEDEEDNETEEEYNDGENQDTNEG